MYQPTSQTWYGTTVPKTRLPTTWHTNLFGTVGTWLVGIARVQIATPNSDPDPKTENEDGCQNLTVSIMQLF